MSFITRLGSVYETEDDSTTFAYTQRRAFSNVEIRTR